MSRLYSFDTIQRFPVPAGEVWRFIASPQNLSLITPPSMRFEIVGTPPASITAGTLIEYRVHPFAGWRVRWVTEITHVEEGARFVDEQREGPYAFWRHEHVLRPVDGGVEMADHLTYRIPYGPAGDIAHLLFVRSRLKHIFRYRFEQLAGRFGHWKA
jgi:ligand-binding SRPBCC domain-containing protein